MIPKFIHDQYDEPAMKYPKRLAIIDLINMACIRDSETDGKKRGCVYSSIFFLASRWHWNRRTVQSFLSQLQDDGVIQYSSNKRGTVIKIVEYGRYK